MNYNYNVQYQTLGQTLGGLSIPIIRYTNHTNILETTNTTLDHHHNPEKVLIIGRVHPGEPNGSLILQHIIEELSSSETNSQYN